VIAVTVGIFVLSVAMFKLVPQQFFPPSNRAEILVDLKLEEGVLLLKLKLQVLYSIDRERVGILILSLILVELL